MVKVDLSLTNPIITITAGVIVTFIVAIILNPLIHLLGTIIGPIIGGFIATYFAKEKKILYALYEGICVMIVMILLQLSFGLTSSLFLYAVLGDIVIGPFFASIGGFIGKIVDNIKIKRKKTVT